MRGWNRSKLLDVTSKIGSGSTPRGGKNAYKAEGISLIRSMNVHDGVFKVKNLAFIDDAQADKLSNVIVETGDVLLNITGASIARCCVAPSNVLPARVNQHVSIIRPNKELMDSEFLAYLLISNQYKSKLLISGDKAGATREALTKTQLQSFEIEYPPIPEQKRIVAIIDQALTDIEQARAKTEQNLKNARELFESYLQQVFSQLGDACELRSMSDKTMLSMIDGDRGKNYPKKAEFLPEGHCLFLNTKNVRKDGFRFDQTMFIDEKLDNLLRKGKLERDDVVITTRGTIGNLGLYDESVEFENIRINSGMLILRPNVESILPSYLFEIMRSEIVRRQIEAKVSGAAQPQLPVNTLNTFEFPVPKSLKGQREAVEMIKEAEVSIKELTRIYSDKLSALDELKKSILQKAFSGELTKSPNNDTSKGAAV